MIKIKLLKDVEILSSVYKITYDNKNNGGSFSCSKATINIGTSCIKNDPLYTLSVISHEIFELILVMMGARFENQRTGENCLFNFDHQTFENAIQIHTGILSKFIC